MIFIAQLQTIQKAHFQLKDNESPTLRLEKEKEKCEEVEIHRNDNCLDIICEREY